MSHEELSVHATENDTQDLSPERGRPRFVVGIGASAGGLEALERLFESMPSKSDMAFVVVQHLSPDYRSLTDQLLARKTHIAICQAENDMLVESDTIYLLPPRKEIILSEGRLLLTDKDPKQYMTLPIDGFLRSLAGDAGPRAVAIILSGTGSDGSRGIRDVHASGGLVIAQDPATAKFDGMPLSAVATGVVDLQLAPEEMGVALERHARGLEGSDRSPRSVAAAPAFRGMDTVFELLRSVYGIDFSAYKADTVLRRTERRLALRRCDSLREYAEQLLTDSDELNQLYKDLLIGVTSFFRDPEAFARLEDDLLRTQLERAGDGEFRAWVAGCATGEEAYSIAIMLHETCLAMGREPIIKVFATDVHRHSLNVAGAGTYSAAQLASVSKERLDRYFVGRGGDYQVTPELRRMVVFAQHNVCKDAPFTKLDLISCRNLLIYFQGPAQKKALSLFHFGLKTGGLLFLGPSEGPGELSDEFQTIDGRWKIYRKRREAPLASDLRLPAPQLNVRIDGARPRQPYAQGDSPLTPVLETIAERCVPPSLLVNERRELIRSFGGAHQFLRVREGWFSTDVLDLVHPEMRTALAGAIPRAMREMSVVHFKDLSLVTGDGPRRVDLAVEPLRAPRAGQLYVLVRIIDASQRRGPAMSSGDINLAEASREERIQLETELQNTRENLQAMIEELETSNEELQATNEELVAANEELQSTNEELHSVNEELYTVNAEYQRKIGELTELTADMDNLLASTEVHTIFLDRELRIRSYTPKIADTFNLLPQDVGRPINSFTHRIDHPDLAANLQAVLETGQRLERQVRDQSGRWYLLRILPYRTEDRTEGVVLTLVDIDQMKQAEAETSRKDQQLASILRNSPNWVFVQNLDGRYLLSDDAFKHRVGRDPIGKTAYELFPREVADELTAQNRRVLAEGGTVETEVTIPHADGPHTYLSIMFPIRDFSGQIVSLGGVRTDVTQLKRAEQQAREAVVQRDRFLAMLSHELRNPLAAIVNALGVIDRLGAEHAESASWLEVIRRRSRHITRLLDDLLDVARIAQNKIEIRREVFDLRSAMHDALEELQPWSDGKQQIVVVSEPSGPIYVNGDFDRLQQVQVNLLLNASRYTPEGGQIVLALAVEDGEAVIRVRDSGVGIAAEMLPTIFDLFVQADEPQARSSGGMGVGLTLVRSIVDLHGGRVDASSAGRDQGAEFVVRLPLAAAEGAVPPAPAIAPPTRPVAQARRLLIVEDDPDIRDALRSLLELDGHLVRAVEDAQAALEAIGADCPEVALIDIGLPGVNGYELARQLREQFSKEQLRLVAVTGFGRRSDRARALEAGFDAHLTKPLFDAPALAEALGGGAAPSPTSD